MWIEFAWDGSQYFASFCDRNCRVSLHGYVFNCSLKLQTLSADTISIKTTQTLTISSSFCFHYVSNCNWIKRTSFRKIIVVSINYFLVISVIVGCFCHSTQSTYHLRLIFHVKPVDLPLTPFLHVQQASMLMTKEDTMMRCFEVCSNYIHCNNVLGKGVVFQ